MVKIHIEMGDRFISLQKLDSSFYFLLGINLYIMSTCNENNLKQTCIFKENFYETDLDKYTETMDCRMLPKTRADIKLQTPEILLRFITVWRRLFPNLRIVLILLTAGTSIAGCEVELKVTHSKYFDKLTVKFAAAKASKISLWS